jgi:hypothetical protein
MYIDEFDVVGALGREEDEADRAPSTWLEAKSSDRPPPKECLRGGKRRAVLNARTAARRIGMPTSKSCR